MDTNSLQLDRERIEADVPRSARTPDAGRELDLSVVVPAYNEVKSLPALVEQIIAAIASLGERTWEVILVDDGSTDGTTQLMRSLATTQAGVKAVLLRTNFGKSAALMAGFELARGA